MPYCKHEWSKKKGPLKYKIENGFIYLSCLKCKKLKKIKMENKKNGTHSRSIEKDFKSNS